MSKAKVNKQPRRTRILNDPHRLFGQIDQVKYHRHMKLDAKSRIILPLRQADPLLRSVSRSNDLSMKKSCPTKICQLKLPLTNYVKSNGSGSKLIAIFSQIKTSKARQATVALNKLSSAVALSGIGETLLEPVIHKTWKRVSLRPTHTLVVAFFTGRKHPGIIKWSREKKIVIPALSY